MRKHQIEIVKKHIIRRFLKMTMVGTSHINRLDVKVKKISQDVVQIAINELIRERFLETRNNECISINPRILKPLSDYLEKDRS